MCFLIISITLQSKDCVQNVVSCFATIWGCCKMLFRTKTGRMIDSNELNELSSMEIEEQGIHLMPGWDEWN